MPATKVRNGKLDFLKFLFAMIIVIHHSRNLMGDEDALFLGGSFAVEFFFIVSGYLMMSSIKRMPPLGAEHPLGVETQHFLARKYKAVCPEIFVAYAAALIFVVTVQDKAPVDTFIKTFWEGIMLRMTGIHFQSINGAVWYISSMLLAMAILYPLIRRFPDMAVKVIVPVASLLILGYFCGNETSPRNPTLWIGWTYKGNLRAIAELGIGICSYGIVEKIKAINFSRAGKLLLTLVEYACYFLVILYMYQEKSSRKDYFYLLLLTAAIIISVSQKGIDSSLFSNKLCSTLGKYSLCIYLSHTYYAEHLYLLLPENYSYAQRMLVYLPCSAITGLMVMVISDLIRRSGPTVTAKLKKCFIESP